MIRKVIEFSARNRLMVLLATAALVVAALYVLKTIRLDALPDLSDTQVIIYSRWPSQRYSSACRCTSSSAPSSCHR